MPPNRQSSSIPLLSSPTFTHPQPIKDTEVPPPTKYAAPLLVTLASITRTIYGIAVKILSSTTQTLYTHYGFPFFELVAFRSAFTAGGAFVALKWQGKELLGDW
jgi:hypothetical protein